MKNKKLDLLIENVNALYSQGKKPEIVEANTSNILIYDNYIVKVTNNLGYLNKVKIIQNTKMDCFYLYKFPYVIETHEGYSLVPMDKLTMLSDIEKFKLNQIPSYLYHEDIFNNTQETLNKLGRTSKFMSNNFKDSQKLFIDKYNNVNLSAMANRIESLSEEIKNIILEYIK